MNRKSGRAGKMAKLELEKMSDAELGELAEAVAKAAIPGPLEILPQSVYYK